MLEVMFSQGTFYEAFNISGWKESNDRFYDMLKQVHHMFLACV